MKDESEVEQEITLAGPRLNCILERNNSGAFTDSTGRTVRYGLGNISKKRNDEFKSSDRIGITKILITPDMVGKTIGVFTAAEIKKEGWRFCNSPRERAQQKFIDWVRESGGIGMFASSVEDFRKAIVDFIANMKKK